MWTSLERTVRAEAAPELTRTSRQRTPLPSDAYAGDDGYRVSADRAVRADPFLATPSRVGAPSVGASQAPYRPAYTDARSALGRSSTDFFRDNCGRVTHTADPRTVHSPAQHARRFRADPAGLVRCRWEDVSCTRRGGRSGAMKRGTVLSRSLCQISPAVGRRRGRRDIAVRRNRRGGIHGGSTATDPH